MNLYLSAPNESARERLAVELQRLRETSVAQPPALAHGLVNLVSYAQVLLDKQGPTEELFQKATSTDIGNLTERLVGSLEFQIGKNLVQIAWYERGMLGVIAALAMFWVGLAVQQRARRPPQCAGDIPRSAATHDTAGPRTRPGQLSWRPLVSPRGRRARTAFHKCRGRQEGAAPPNCRRGGILDPRISRTPFP